MRPRSRRQSSCHCCANYSFIPRAGMHPSWRAQREACRALQRSPQSVSTDMTAARSVTWANVKQPRGPMEAMPRWLANAPLDDSARQRRPIPELGTKSLKLSPMDLTWAHAHEHRSSKAPSDRGAHVPFAECCSAQAYGGMGCSQCRATPLRSRSRVWARLRQSVDGFASSAVFVFLFKHLPARGVESLPPPPSLGAGAGSCLVLPGVNVPERRGAMLSTKWSSLDFQRTHHDPHISRIAR